LLQQKFFNIELLNNSRGILLDTKIRWLTVCWRSFPDQRTVKNSAKQLLRITYSYLSSSFWVFSELNLISV